MLIRWCEGMRPGRSGRARRREVTRKSANSRRKGAVGNALTTLADRGEADREAGRPVRYRANAATAAAAAAIAPRAPAPPKPAPAPAPAAPKPAVSPVPPLADGHRLCRRAAQVHPGAGQGLAVYGEPAGAAAVPGCVPSHRREIRLRRECKARKPDFLDVSGLRGTRGPTPHERAVMPAHLVPLYAVPVPGPPARTASSGAPRVPRPALRPEQPPTAARDPAVGMSPPAGRGPRPCAPSGADSGLPAAGGGRPGRPAGGHRARRRMLRRRAAARHRLDVPGAVGAVWRRSRAAGQPVLPAWPARGPGTEQEAARRRRPPPGTPTPWPAPPRTAVPLPPAPGAGRPAGGRGDRRRGRPPRA